MVRTIASISIICWLSNTCIAQPDSLFYEWKGQFLASAINYEEKSDSSDFMLVGEYMEFPERIAVEIPIRRGKPTGLFKAYYPDGKLLIRAVYAWGYLHGDWTEYDEDGIITVKGQYRDGKRHGAWVYRRDGIRGRYKRGLKSGRWKYYEGSTLVRIEKWRKGRLQEGGTFRLGIR